MTVFGFLLSQSVLLLLSFCSHSWKSTVEFCYNAELSINSRVRESLDVLLVMNCLRSIWLASYLYQVMNWTCICQSELYLYHVMNCKWFLVEYIRDNPSYLTNYRRYYWLCFGLFHSSKQELHILTICTISTTIVFDRK